MQRGSSDGGGPCDEEVGDFDAAIYTLDSVCSAVSFSLSLGRARSAFAAADLFSFDSVTSTSSSGLGGACWSGEDGLATPLPTVGGTSSGRRSSTTSLPELPGSVSSTAATAPTAARCPSVAITTAALAPSQESSPRGPTGRPPLPPRHTRGLPPRASSGGGSGPTAYAADPAPTSSGQKRLRADEEDDVDGHMQECGDGAAEQSPTPVRGAAAPPGTCGAAGGDVSSWASMMQHLASSYYQEYGSVPDVPSHLDAVRQQTKRQRTAGGGGPGAPAKAQPAVPAGPAPQLGAM